MNATTNQKPRQEIIAGFQKGNNGYFRELQAENKDLRLALEDYQKALEQIMSKYRQQTAYFLKQTKKNYTAIPSSKCCPEYNQCKCVDVSEQLSSYNHCTSPLPLYSWIQLSLLLQIIGSQAEKINEMAAVMRTAAEIDEESEMKYVETLGRLKEENTGLREILDMANKYGSPKNETVVDSKIVQTEEM